MKAFFCSGNVTCIAVVAVAKMERHWLVNPFLEYLIYTNITYIYYRNEAYNRLSSLALKADVKELP